MNKEYLELLFSIKFETEKQKKETISIKTGALSDLGDEGNDERNHWIQCAIDEIESKLMSIDILIEKYLELHK